MVGIDGVRFDTLTAVRTPALDRVAARGFLQPVRVHHSGPTISGPCWSTIVTGVLADDHQVWDNDFTGHRPADHHDFLARARDAGLPTYLAAGWPPLVVAVDGGPLFAGGGTFTAADYPETVEAWHAADQAVVDGAVTFIAEVGPAGSAAFVYLGGADEVCHELGVTQPYLDYIEASDARLGQVIDAVEARADAADWTIIVVTDHGHLTAGGHGGDTDEERTAWIAAYGPGILVGEPGQELLLEQADVAAHCFAALGLSVDDPAMVGLPFSQRSISISWPGLTGQSERVARFTRNPHRVTSADHPADELLRLSCLVYGDDRPERREQAQRLLAAHPELAATSLHTAAAVGDVAATRWLLESGAQVEEEAGPFRWVPLLYAAYSRLDSTSAGHSTLEVARLLLDYGADPNAGYLWEGLTPPFTALTGAFGGGEGNQPPHQFRDELARLLLDHGADPNDGQTLYNRGLGGPRETDASHLELLLAYGLGRERGGPWRQRLGPAVLSPAEMLHDELMYAALRDRPERARLAIEQGVDVNRASTGHPAYGGATPLALATALGNRSVVAIVTAAGATPVADPVVHFLGACLSGDERAARQQLASTPDLLPRARTRMPDLLLRAAESGRPAAVRLLAGLGLDLDDRTVRGRTPLHVAALAGDQPIVDTLLALGADPTISDATYGSTPAGWALHAGFTGVAEQLARIDHRAES